MVSSYHMRRGGYQSSDKISTRLTSSHIKGEFYTTWFFGQNLAVTVTSKPHLVGSWISKSLFLHRHRLHYHHKHHCGSWHVMAPLPIQPVPHQYPDVHWPPGSDLSDTGV